MPTTVLYHVLRCWCAGIALACGAISPLRAQPICVTPSLASSDLTLSRATDELPTDEILYVPVVFHVLYHQEEENVSEELITDQLRQLNKDFRAQNEDREKVFDRFQSLIGAANIQFYLAEQDPSGQPHAGVTRTTTEQLAFADGRIHDRQRGGHDAWDPTRFLNVWVANLNEDVLGWATPLRSEVILEEGVVINYRWLGTQGESRGRTLTHEIGHWLGLHHLGFGQCNTDDTIDDTPIQRQASTGCQTETMSCGSFDMNQNFMERAGDACMLFFTPGQVARMRQKLLTGRPGLIQEPLVLGLPPDPLPEICVFPNPTTDRSLHVTLPEVTDSPEFRLTDLHGRSVMMVQRRMTAEQWVLTPQLIRPGVYLLRYRQFYHKVIFR